MNSSWFSALDRIIGIAHRRGKLIGERRLRVLLPGQVLVLGDAGVIVGLRVVHHRDRLVPFLVEHHVAEAQRAVGQLAEAEAEELVDRPGETRR